MMTSEQAREILAEIGMSRDQFIDEYMSMTGSSKPSPRTVVSWFNERPTDAVMIALRFLQHKAIETTSEMPVKFTLEAGEKLDLTITKTNRQRAQK